MIEIYSQNVEDTWFTIACTKQQIITTSFGSDQQSTLRNVLNSIPFNVTFQIFHEPIAFAKNIIATLKEICDGRDTNTNLALSISSLPSYTKEVLKTTSAIPIGYVTTYGSIAKAVGGGARAVGNIMASNPFAPIVPCHRVVRADFTLGGYGGGLKVKMNLLVKEKRGFTSSKIIDINGGQLTVYPVENVLRKLDNSSLRKS